MFSKSLDDLNTTSLETSVISNKSENPIDKDRPKSDKKYLPYNLSKKRKIYATTSDLSFNSVKKQDFRDMDKESEKQDVIVLQQKPISKETLVEMIELLVEKGADLNCLARVNRLTQMPCFEDVKYVTPLLVAVYNQNLTAVDRLIRLGCDINLRDSVTKINALHMACYMSKIELVSLLIESKRLDLEARSKNGFNCLHWLALSDNEENSLGIALLIIANLIKKHELEKKANREMV